MKRREFIVWLVSSVVGSPFAAEAQPQSMKQIGILMGIAKDAEGQSWVNAFFEGLQILGWTDGRNIHVVDRWGGGDVDLLRSYATEFANLKPDIIVVNGGRALSVLEPHITTIPIVLIGTADPAGGGFEANLSRPSGNVTGFLNFELSLLGKMLELLKEVAPATTRVALVANSHNPGFETYVRYLQSAAEKLGVHAIGAPVEEPSDLEKFIREFGREPNGAVLVPPDVFVFSHRGTLVQLLDQFRLPAVSPISDFVKAGMLMSYGADRPDLFRRAASYVDRILKGEHPSDLPIQAPTKYKLAVNVKVANALGLKIPTELLALADEVIE